MNKYECMEKIREALKLLENKKEREAIVMLENLVEKMRGEYFVEPI